MFPRLYVLPTLRCPAKKKTMDVGLNFVLGADVSAFGFKKSVSFQLIPVPGDLGKTCTRQGPIYNLETEFSSFMMMTPKIQPGDVTLPCIGA